MAQGCGEGEREDGSLKLRRGDINCGMKTNTMPLGSRRSGRYLPSAAVAEEYGLSIRHLKYLRSTRRLSYIRAGHRTVLYDRLDVEQFMRARRVDAVGAGAEK